MIHQIGFDLYGIGAIPTTRSWELQRSYSWQLLFPSTIGGIPGLWISQYCTGVSFSDYSMEVTTIKYGADLRKYSGPQKIEYLTVHFICPVDQSPYTYFLNWKNLVISPEGYYRPKQEYAKDIYLLLYEGLVETQRFRLRGCFPIDLPVQDLSYEREDVVRYTVHLNVDVIETGSVTSNILNVGRIGRQILKGVGIKF